VDHFDHLFELGLTAQDRSDLVAYLGAVGDGRQPYERDGVLLRLAEIMDSPVCSAQQFRRVTPLSSLSLRKRSVVNWARCPKSFRHRRTPMSQVSASSGASRGPPSRSSSCVCCALRQMYEAADGSLH
jgi:hypothetical protein